MRRHAHPGSFHLWKGLSGLLLPCLAAGCVVLAFVPPFCLVCCVVFAQESAGADMLPRQTLPSQSPSPAA